MNTTTYQANATRLTAQLPAIARHLGHGWTAHNHIHGASETTQHLTHTSGLRIKATIWDHVGDRDRVDLYDLLPLVPADVAARDTAHITHPHIRMSADKLDNPAAFAREITRRMLPGVRTAAELVRARIATVHGDLTARDQAATLIGEIPALSDPTRIPSKGRDERYLTCTVPRAAARADGTRVGKDVYVETAVTATYGVASATVQLTGLSAAAARAAIEAALAVTTSEQATLEGVSNVPNAPLDPSPRG